jgi:subtilisin family serine protease
MNRSTFQQAVRVASAIIALALPRAVVAQIIPPIQVPELPVRGPIDIDRTLERTVDATDPRRLRQLRVADLLRRNRRLMESDPRGAPILRSEVVAVSPSEEALIKARAVGFEIARRRRLDGLDLETVVLRAPERMSTRRALRELREADPQGTYDFNHVYVGTGEVEAAPTTPLAPSSEVQLVNAKVGMIDGGVDRSHVVFKDVTMHEHGCDSPIPSTHGTAVASLIAGRTGDFQGAAPGAQLWVADVYCNQPNGGAVDAIAEAFGWLASEHVPVINVSLVGPANAMLERIVNVMIARGHLIVAAVGNDGPSAKPLYPAAYEGVIAVTGVDGRNRVLLEACRGKHVDFAAPGSDLSAASSGEIYALVRGTSFAAPIVSGLLAARIAQPDRKSAEAAIVALIAQAADLGERGPDRIYGNGFVGQVVRARK